MPDDSMRTVLVALGSGVAVALAKVAVAAFTGSTAMAAEAAHSLADTGNDLFLFVAQRRSSRPPDDQHPLGYGREAYFWALIAAIGVFIAGAAFSLRQGIGGGSYKATAERLVLHKNTVQYRIRRAEQSLGRPVAQNRHDVELAPRASYWLGPSVLWPASR